MLIDRNPVGGYYNQREIIPEGNQGGKKKKNQIRKESGMEGGSDRERAKQSKTAEKVQEIRQELLTTFGNKGISLDAEARIEIKEYGPWDDGDEEYVRLNENLLKLRHFLSTLMGDEETNKRIKRITSKLGGISFLRFEDFILIGEGEKKEIRELIEDITVRYKLQDYHWGKMGLREFSKLTLIKLFNRFLEEDYACFRTSKIDNIFGQDMFFCPCKKNLSFIAAEVILEEKEEKSVDSNLLRRNKDMPLLCIRHGIRCKENRFIQKQDLKVSLWTYIKIEKRLLIDYLKATDEDEKEKIEGRIFTTALQGIIVNFQKLKEEERRLREEISTLEETIGINKRETDMVRDKRKNKEIISVKRRELVDKKLELNKRKKELLPFQERLREAAPFIEYIQRKIG